MTSEKQTGETPYQIQRKQKPKIGRGAKIAFGVASAAMIGVAAYPLLVPKSADQVRTSGVEEFQTQGDGGSFARIAEEPEVGEEAPVPSFDLGPLEEQGASLAKQNETLSAEIARLQKELDATKAAAGEDAERFAGLVSQLEEIQKANEAAIARLEAQMAAGQNDTQLAAIEAEKEAARLAELERMRAEQREQLAARIKSPSVVFDETNRNGGAGSGGADATAEPGYTDGYGNAPEKTSAERAREFVEAGAEPVAVETAEVISDPAHTVLQGTLIRATLENAVDSSLPGTVTAMVNYPVHSFDGSRVVIPAGSRVFGQYSAEVKIGQGRILVGWTRIVTPEGQSVEIAAYGGDEQGRSGITGKVNTRFGTRFGGAALVSLIGAAPAIAVANMEDASDVEIDTAESVAEDLSSVTGSVVEEYVKLPPIIRVSQGTQITIMVDRDLEFH